MRNNATSVTNIHVVLALASSALISVSVACSGGGSSAPPPTTPPVTYEPQDYSAEKKTEPDTANESGTPGMWSSLDPNCKTKDECPPANPQLMLAGPLVGQQGASVNWQLNAFDQTQPTRRLAIIVSGVPDGALVSPPLQLKVNSTLSITYRPAKAESGAIGVIIRDYDRCLVTEPEGAHCISTLYNATYDRKLADVPYQIAGTTTVPKCPTGWFASKPPGC